MRSSAAIAWAAALMLPACGGGGRPTQSGEAKLPIAVVEARYQETRALRDAIDVTRSRGATSTPKGVPLADLVARYSVARGELQDALGRADPGASPVDVRALDVMRRTTATELVAVELESAGAADCAYDPEQLIRAGGPDALSQRLYACFGAAAESLRFENEATDRLTLLGRLAVEPDPARREQLWRALAPLWAAVNADNGPQSPYRTLVRAGAARLQDQGQQLGDAVRGIGVDPQTMEGWLVQVLEAWRETAVSTPLEPWDFAYEAGAAQRALAPSIPLGSLRPINDRFYADLGADPVALDVRYDLEPRAGKDPVAFTTFGRRPRVEADRVIPGEPWVFASYRIGGLDNLLELLHETGHGVHIAAIRTRPAFADWPDSDIFTEALADVAALDLYEPAWQQRYLRACVPIQTGIRAKYASIVMDVAWALFELRVHRQPQRDPNAVWTEITRDYLGIRPHPELAWWAVRGQLVDAPGYMLNYAAGAILVADLRARIRALQGPDVDPGWYARMSAGLYRFGLERPSAQVIEEFLGRPISPDALLTDLARARTAGPPSPTGSPGGSCLASSSRG